MVLGLVYPRVRHNGCLVHSHQTKPRGGNKVRMALATESLSAAGEAAPNSLWGDPAWFRG